MALFKCKMCGGDLILVKGQSVAECEYCGSWQTVPVADDEKKLTLFARANRLRATGEFDKAANIYESIVSDFPEEAEAYWGLVLCKYGVEYVDDPATGKKIPTCHRSSFDSVMEDPDFEQAMENADTVARRVYREEAKKIEEIRKGIIVVSANETPYDIFICYKETDENGARTLDSVLAQDLYNALTEKGYRTFFARITLEDKLGQEYEPYIFAALNSAKIMLAVGTDYEYFNAVWVKNEWSRFLKLMERDKAKHLIPCFKGIDAYDMPREFAKLQAQDLGKVGALQDLLRGIEKLMPKKNNTTVIQERIYVGGNDTITPLLKRVSMFLEDRDWKSADTYCEKVLDMDPEIGEAYFGKLLAEYHVSSAEELSALSREFTSSANYQKALRFADKALTQKLETVIRIIEEREEAQHREKARQAELARKQAEENRKKAQKKARNAAKVAKIAVPIVCLAAVLMMLVPPMLKGKEEVAPAVNVTEPSISLEETVIPVETVSPEYAVAEKLAGEGRIAEAAMAFYKIGEIERSFELWDQIAQRETISAGYYHTVGLKKDGTLVAAGSNMDLENKKLPSGQGQCDVEDWTDIIAVSAGSFHTVGLKKDGTVIAIGRNKAGQCNVSDWTDIVAITAGESITVGLKADGTVIAVGSNSWGVCNVVQNWTDIISLSAGGGHVVGLKANGTVVATGYNHIGQCDVSTWTDITAISANGCNTIGLQKDGTVITTGIGAGDVSEWKDIVAITAGDYHTVGLRADNCMVAEGENWFNWYKNVVKDWSDIVAISASIKHTVALRSDGTVVAVGDSATGRLQVEDWTNIALPGELTMKPPKAVDAPSEAEKLLSEGKTAEAAMEFYKLGNKQRSFELWKQVIHPDTFSASSVAIRNDGTVLVGHLDAVDYVGKQVAQWTDMVSVDAGQGHVVGLKSDGTVVAVGINKAGQCDVGTWNDIVAVAAGIDITVGLKSDGTVVTAGKGYLKYTDYDTSDWEDVVAISAGQYIVGMKADGTVYASGDAVSDWSGIVAVDATREIVGIQSDGTVVMTKGPLSDELDVSSWTDIVDVGQGTTYIVGLKSNGTVVVTGKPYNTNQNIDVADWEEIVAISADPYVVGLKKDGTVLVTGGYAGSKNKTSDWTDIAIPGELTGKVS